MAEEKYYKIPESGLTEIADVIRFHRKSASKYQFKDFAKRIKALLVLPSGEAFGGNTAVVLPSGHANVFGRRPTVYQGSACSEGVPPICSGASSAVGMLVEEGE